MNGYEFSYYLANFGFFFCLFAMVVTASTGFTVGFFVMWACCLVNLVNRHRAKQDMLRYNAWVQEQ